MKLWAKKKKHTEAEEEGETLSSRQKNDLSSGSGGKHTALLIMYSGELEGVLHHFIVVSSFFKPVQFIAEQVRGLFNTSTDKQSACVACFHEVSDLFSPFEWWITVLSAISKHKLTNTIRPKISESAACSVIDEVQRQLTDLFEKFDLQIPIICWNIHANLHQTFWNMRQETFLPWVNILKINSSTNLHKPGAEQITITQMN